MDSEEPRASKDTWTTVGKKPAVKKDKSTEGTAGGIMGATKAAAMAKAQQNSPSAVKKPEAIRIREEQLKRLAKKNAPLPEILTKRSESADSSMDSDEEQQRSKCSLVVSMGAIKQIQNEMIGAAPTRRLGSLASRRGYLFA